MNRQKHIFLVIVAAMLCMAGSAYSNDISMVSDLDDVNAIINAAWTNTSTARIIPPGDFVHDTSLGLTSQDFIHIPVAFRPIDSLSSEVRPYLPNLVNMQYVSNGSSIRIFIPLSYYQPFEDAIATALLSAGINLSEIFVIDTLADFTGGTGGDVHCISNPLMDTPSEP